MDRELDEKNPKMAVEFSNSNREKMIRLFPSSLSKKEEGLYVRISKSKANYLNKLSSLFSEMNEIYAYVDKFTPCKKRLLSLLPYSSVSFRARSGVH